MAMTRPTHQELCPYGSLLTSTKQLRFAVGVSLIVTSWSGAVRVAQPLLEAEGRGSASPPVRTVRPSSPKIPAASEGCEEGCHYCEGPETD